jgi:HK97 gp10 family phage protein
VTSNYVDLTNLAKDLFKASENAEAATQGLLESAGNSIAADAKSRVRVKTGKLKNSINVKSEPLKVTVGPDEFYGTFIEYGTGTKGEFPGAMYEIRPKNGSVLAFKVGGKQVFARSVKHPGIKAYPFMRPATEQWVDDLPADMAHVGVMLISGHNPAKVAS